MVFGHHVSLLCNGGGVRFDPGPRRLAPYVKVPEGEDGDHHGRGGPAFAVGAVEDEGRVGVLGQGALHGLQELIKVLEPRSQPHQVNAGFFFPLPSSSLILLHEVNPEIK